MSPDTSVRPALSRLFRRALPWALALAVATCTDDSTGPSKGGVGYFAFRPVYSGVSASLSQFGIVADSVHVLLTRPVDQVVLDTTVFFPPDSLELRMALPVMLEQSPETLTAMIEIKSAGVVLFVDTLKVQVIDGPPNPGSIATATLDYVGPGNSIKVITVAPGDTTIAFGDTLFYTTTAIDTADNPVASYYVAWRTSDTAVARINAQGRLIAPNVRGSVRVIGYTPTGIADTADITFAPVPNQLLADSGAAQAGQVGDSLATEFVARVMAADAQPVAGIHVRFQATTAGGAVRDTLLISDANGRVRTRGAFGTAAGAYSWTATIVGTAITANFTGTASAGAPSMIAAQVGDAQVDTAGRALPLPLTARVSDAFDNPIAGVKVYWTRTVGTGAVAADSSFTDGSGLAATGYTLGAVGTDSIEARIAGTSATVLFHATSISGAPATMAIVLGDAQADTVGRLLADSLAVTVASATAFPVTGTPVVWTVLRGGVVTSDTTLTDSTGRAAVGYTLGTLAGTDSVRAQAGGTSATFTATALAGAPVALAILSGDAQSDTAGFVLPAPFVVRAADAFDNPVAGTKILWTIASGSGTLSLDSSFTNASGQAFTGYTLGPVAATDSITATLACACATVTFTTTALQPAPAAIQASTGDLQSDTATRTLAAPLVARVLSAGAVPLSGARVVWTVIRGGSLSVDTTISDLNGLVSANYTLGTLTGTDSVEARTVIGGLTYVFTAGVSNDLPAQIAIQSGNAQSDTTGYALDAPLVARVTDAFGNVVTGAQITWAVTSGGGSVVPDTGYTDGTGDAKGFLTLGPTAGTSTVRASLSGTSAFVDFTATALTPAVASIATLGGDGQTLVVNRVSGDTLTISVRDGSNNPIPGVDVLWSVIPAVGDLEILGATGVMRNVSDSLGVARAVFTGGTQAGTVRIEAQAGTVIDSLLVTQVADTAAALVMVSGDGQSDTTGNAIPLSFVARAEDAFGNPVQGARVAFTRIAGSGSLFADTLTTNAAGEVAMGYFFGPVPGTDTIRATLVSTGDFVDFTAITIAGTPASISFVSGFAQTDTVAQPLAESLMVFVQDVDSRPLGGIPLVWTTTNGGTLSADTTVTDSLGHAWVRLTLGTVAGEDTVHVGTVGGTVTSYLTVDAVNALPSAIAIVSGNAQADTAGRALPAPFVARVTDAYNNPVPGAAVFPTVTAGNGALSFADTTYSAADGTVSFVLTLGTVAGTNTVRAALAGTSAFVDFNATGVTAAAGSVTAHAGYGQTDTVGFTLTDSLKILAVDGGAVPLVNAPVVWTVVRGGAVAAETTYTDALGYSANRYTLGTVAGEDSIEARVVGSAPVALFTANALPGSGTLLSIVSGNAQADTIGSTLADPMMVEARDAYGNPSPYQTVAFSVVGGTGTLTSDTVQTDGTGRASVFYTLGSVPAVDTVRATLVGNGTFVDFAATAVTGVPTSLLAYSGDGQADTVMATLADSLVVQLRDASSRPVAGVWLYWQSTAAALSADSILTDSLGRAAVEATFGMVAAAEGAVYVRNADSSLTTLFTLTAHPGAPDAMSYIDGDAQTGVVGTTLPVPFSFDVYDLWGNKVPGAPVAFVRLFGSGFATPDTAYSDGAGNAQSSYTLGGTIGTDTIAVRLVGTASEFILTAAGDAGVAASLSYVTGTGQSDTVARALPAPFRVNVQDAGGNPRSNVWVRWSKTAATGVLAADSVLTDASGVAEVAYTLGTVTGFDTVFATLEGLTDTVKFYAFAENEVAASIAVASGDSGSATVGAATGLPVVFVVRDSYGNPVGGQSVSFSATPGSSAPQISGATTGEDGLASAGFWTVDAAPGYNTMIATTGAFSASATAIGFPAGTTSIWAGATDADWSNAANWIPAAVPSVNDTAFVPAGTPFQPVLNASVNVGRLAVAGAVTIDVGAYTLTSSNGIVGAGAVFTATTGLVSVHGGSWDATATNLQADSVVLGSGSVTNDLTVASGGFTFSGNTLAVPGNVTLFGPLSMGNEADSLDIGGDLTVDFTDMAGATAAGTIVLRGDFIGSSLFRPVGSNTFVFAGADTQHATFGDWTSSWFNQLVVNNAAGLQVAGNVRILGGVTQALGRISGTQAYVEGGITAAADSAWAFTTTALGGTTFTAPDTLFGNVALQFSAPVTLPGDFTILGDLMTMSQGPIDLGTNSLRVSGALSQSLSTGGLLMATSADTIEVGGLFSVGAGDNDFTGGTIVLHGGIRQYGGSLFRPGALVKTVFAGSGGQTVQFDTPGSGATQSAFGQVEFADSVTLLSNTWFYGDVTLAAGGKALGTTTTNVFADLAGATWDNWRPATTVLEVTPTILPDSLWGNARMTQSVGLTKPFTVGGNFQMLPAAAELALNGWPMRVGGALTVQGTVRMVNAADSLDVEGLVTWNTVSTAGMLTDGVLVVRGDFTAPSGGLSFEPSGNHRVVFDGAAPHTVSTPVVTPTNNVFNLVELRGTGGLRLTTDVRINGAFSEAEATPLTISGNAELATYGAITLDGVVFDSAGLSVTASLTTPDLHALTFRNRPGRNNLQLALPGNEGPLALADFVFEDTTKSAGAYFVWAEDNASDGLANGIHLVNSSPLNGEAFSGASLANDGSSITWSRLAFATQPLDGTAATALSPVRVAVLAPNGDTLTGFTGPVTVAIANNPAGGALTGTTTANAVGGVATFADLSIDNVGVGYTLAATAPGLGQVTSSGFNIALPLPAGFDVQWVGASDGNWFNAANWSTGQVPGDSSNVFLGGIAANQPDISGSSALVNRIRLAPTATLTIQGGAALTADSSVEAGGGIGGTGALNFQGSGTISGPIGTSAYVNGVYAVDSAASFGSALNIAGDLTLAGADTVNVTGLLATTGGTGRLIMTGAQALVDVDGPADFTGGSTSGQLTAGTLRIAGDLTSGGSNNDAFAPSAGHLTVLNGGGDQAVTFAVPDTSTTGSHFGDLQVSTTGTALMHSGTWVTGNLVVTTGAALADDSLGVAVLGLTAVDAGGSILPSRLALGGSLNLAVGATYAVPLTVYFGAGAPLPIPAAPYDTLQVSREATATAGLTISGDLRVIDGWGSPARFEVGDQTVAVGGSVSVNGDGAVAMTNSSGLLTVAGDFSTNGASTQGLLTGGVLQIGGSFRQAADGDGRAYFANVGHTTRFTGAGFHQLEFDSPAQGPGDPNNSRFGTLDIPDGVVATIKGITPSEQVVIGGSVTHDTTTFGNTLVGLAGTSILATADSVHLQGLQSYGDFTAAGTALYQVGSTALLGGSGGTLPHLAYTDLLIANQTFTLGDSQTVAGQLQMGVPASEVGPPAQPGELIVGGHILTAGNLEVTGLGLFTMGAGDSVDVGGVTFRGAPSNGHLTGGMLVVRGIFNTVGSNAFQADAAHRTVLLATGPEDIYPTSGSWFGKLILLDAAPRRVRSPEPLRVLDSLVLGASTSGLTDTLGFTGGSIEAMGPVLTVSGSNITIEGSVLFADDSVKIFGTYAVGTTIFGGTTQPIPALTYQHIAVQGTAFLTSPLDNTGYNLGIYEGSVPANLDLAGHRLVTGSLTTDGNATLTMASAADTLVARGGVNFHGGNETGKLTAGVLQVYSSFTQANTYSDSSFVATGTHETRFDDSSGTQFINPTTMFAGASRFNHVTVTGTGVSFTDQGWVGGNVTLPSSATIVTGGTVNLFAGLSDAYHHWNVDTTVVWGHNTSLPDSMSKNVMFLTKDTLRASLKVGGEVVITDTFVVNGNTLRAYGGLKVMGPGVLQMTNASDQVTVSGVAEFQGAVSTGLMTDGRLTLNGDLVTGNVTAGSFDPTGNHVTVLAGAAQQNLMFVGGPQGFGPNQVVTYNGTLYIPFGMTVKGTFRDSVASTLAMTSTSQLLTVGRMEARGVDLTDLNVQMGDQSTFDTVAFHFSGPQSGYALSIYGPGRPTPLDLHAINFVDYDQSSILLQVNDTVENADQIAVRMFGSTPFNGSSKTLLSGSNQPGAEWSTLWINSTFPTTVDSLVPFSVALSVREPDGFYRSDVSAAVSASLNANPGNLVLNGGTTASFDGPNANFFGLRVDSVATGLVIRFEVQGRPIDFVESPLFDAINPAPVGSIVWDGGASDGLWNSPANWVGDAVPTNADSVFIGGGQYVTLNASNDTIGTLVLGSGAQLDLGGNTLTTTGNVVAGQTIVGAGSLVLASEFGTISGTLPATTIKGNISASGTVQINGDLVIDGTLDGAEFNVGGHKVAVSGTTFTQNGGLLTMDAAADTFITASASFTGGDENGRLTDGVLIIQGSNFDQGFGDPNSFHATGNHTTVFADLGVATAVNISEPATSQFANVKVRNATGVDFNESGLGNIKIAGDLEVGAGGIATGDTIQVLGNYISDASASLTANVVTLVNTPTLAGTYNVATTWYSGSGVGIAPAPSGYQALRITGAANLGAAVSARSVTINGGGTLDVNGQSLQMDSLFANAGQGALLMDDAEDTVIVTTRAQFNGVTPAVPMTAGYLEIRGDLDVSPNASAFGATAGHVIRFAGAASHVMNFPGEGNVTPLGTVVIDTGTVLFNDNSLITGDLILHDGALADSALNRDLEVRGAVQGDNGAGTGLMMGRLTLSGTLDWQGNGLKYQPSTTEFAGTGQVIPQLPYAEVVVSGSATLGGDLTWNQGSVDSAGVLTLGGHRLDVATGGLLVTDSARLVMRTTGDTLWVLGTAIFSSDANSAGDYTTGVIRAKHFIQSDGSFGGTTSFVQTDSNRIVPQAGDTIEFFSAGPTGSMLKTLVLNGVGDSVYVAGPDLWISDSLVIQGSLDALTGAPGTEVIVGSLNGTIGTVSIGAGTLRLDALGVGGPLSNTAGTYDVALTKFIGGGQLIPNGLPYNNVEVQYHAALGGNVSLNAGGIFEVNNIGDLDMAGYDLTATTFRTNGFGQLTMASDASTLTAYSVAFNGDSTNLSLTAGTIVTQFLSQDGTNNPRSYAPTGTHRLVLQNLGTAGDGVGVSFGSGSVTESHANILVAEDYGVVMTGAIYAMDTLKINVPVNAQGSQSVYAYGPVIFGPNAEPNFDTLFVFDTLAVTVDTANGHFYGVNSTVFMPSAKPFGDIGLLNNVIIEGSQALTVPLTLNAGLTLRNSGQLVPTGQKVRVNSLDVTEQGGLVMVPGDTVETGTANFHGGSGGGSLEDGVLRVRDGLFVSNGIFGSDTYKPNGMVTEFYGGATAQLSMDVVSPDYQFIDTLRVIGGTTVQLNSQILVLGPTTIKDGSTFNASSASGAIDFRGGATVLDTAYITSSGSNTLFFSKTLSVSNPGHYNVQAAYLQNMNDIPDLPYQYLTIGDGVHDTLSHDLTVGNHLILTASVADTQDLVLNGWTLSTPDLSIGGHSRISMLNAADTLLVSGNALFGGADLTGRLTAGVIRIGGNFTQNNSTSTQSFASTGTHTEFVGSATHSVSFQSPFAFQSHFADLSVLDGGTLQPTTGIVVTGTTVVDTSSTFSGLLLPNGADATFEGKVKVLDLGQFTASNGAPSYNTIAFHDSLIVAPTATYAVFNSIFQGTDGIPEVNFTHLYLRRGVHLTMTHDIVAFGSLNLQNEPGFGGTSTDTVRVRLNGNRLTAFGFSIQGLARITMDSVADTLSIGSAATFRGLDQDTAMTAGVIRIGGSLAQDGAYSVRSFAPAGTRTEFYGAASHSVSFTHPNAASSRFADVDVRTGSTLAPTTGITVAGAMTVESSAHFDGSAMPGGTAADFLGPVTVQSGGDFHSFGTAFMNFYGTGSVSIGTGAAQPFFATNTGLIDNHDVQDLGYVNLYLAGTDSIRSTNVTASGHIFINGETVVDNGYTLKATKNLEIDGGSAMLENVNGLVLVDSTLSTLNGGVYRSQNSSASATVHDLVWTSAQPSSDLSAGGLNVTGSFTVSGSGTFLAQPAFVTTFTGGGNHVISTGQVGGTVFGELATIPVTQEADSLTIAQFDIRTDKLTLGNQVRVIGAGFGNGAFLETAQLNVTNVGDTSAVFERVMLKVYTLADRPMVFNQAVFTGYLATDVQLSIIHPGSGAPFYFGSIDFDDVAIGQTGAGLQVQDIDGLLPYLNVQVMNGPDMNKNLLKAIGVAIVNWYAS